MDRVRLGRSWGRHRSRSVLGTQLGRGDVEYLNLDEPEISSPIVMSYRTNDGSTLLAHILNLIDEFDDWTEAKIAEFS